MKWLSLFSGIGGFDKALTDLGHEIIGACEIDQYARQIYSKHFPGVRIYEDAKKLQASDLPDFDGLCAGFPCQTFSVAGKRLGFEDTRGTLFYEIARIAKQKRPKFLFLENVKGLLSHDRGRTFATILSTFDELGYDAEWQVINSKYFVPQNRERIFIIAYLRGVCRGEILPLGNFGEISSKMQPEQQEGKTGVRCEVSTLDSRYSAIRNSGETYISRGIKQIGNVDQKGHNSLWGRVYDPEGIAPNLNSNGGGFGANTGLYQQKNRIRRLTPIECERLQGFPDNWTDGISDTQRYKCLGNAVTVPVISYIARSFDNI